MTKITPDNINQAIQEYWGMRAEGFSLSNNDEFADPDNPYRQLLQRKLGLNHSGQKALDVGCGPGFLAIELAKMGYKSTGIDSSEPMLVRARENARGLVERFLLADAIEAPFTDNSFDVIASRNVVWNLPDPMRAYKNWFRWLKPSGILIVFDGNHYRYLTDSIDCGNTDLVVALTLTSTTKLNNEFNKMDLTDENHPLS